MGWPADLVDDVTGSVEEAVESVEEAITSPEEAVEQYIEDPLKEPGRALEKGQKALEKAQKVAIASRMEMFRTAMAELVPYREAGQAGLDMLRAEAGAEGPLVAGERARADELLTTYGARRDLGPRATTALKGEYGRGLEARESIRRPGRYQDIVNIGRGFAARGAGATGAVGSSISDLYIRGAQQQAQRYAERSAAAQVPLALASQAAQRGVYDYTTYKYLKDR